MDDNIYKRLMFVKRLFLHGLFHSEKNTELDRFLAIHHLDNAIELFLKIIATKESILTSARQDIKFKDLWEEVNKQLQQKVKYTLPLKDQMFALHDTRNLAQHQGDAPSYEVIIKYQGYSKDFLFQCFRDIFEIDFNDVYASILVKDDKIREALIEAEKAIAAEKYKESITAATKAFAHLKLKERGDFTSEKLRSFTNFGVIRDNETFRVNGSYSFSRVESEVSDFVRGYLENYHTQLNTRLKENARRINEFAEAIEEELAILKLGIDYKEFKSFSKVSPYSFFTINSADPVIGEVKADSCTREKALFCHNFVLESALRLQNLG